MSLLYAFMSGLHLIFNTDYTDGNRNLNGPARQ